MKNHLRKLFPKRLNPLHWRKIAYTDTHGLRNRAWLFDSAALLYEQKKKSWDFLLLYIDLRNFRTVNNQFSHSAGNEVLKEFYKLLEAKFRTHIPGKSFKIDRKCHEKDILVVREGGDEFVVFLPLGVCDEESYRTGLNAIKGRLDGLYVVYKGIKVTARTALVSSRPTKQYDNFLDFFHAADKQLSILHKKEN